ncbi:alpha/beta fold hydrolase [Aeromicrobium sp. P5_D10]
MAPSRADSGSCPTHRRGYGRSTGPAPTADHSTHCKRAVAEDVLTVMRSLGHERFALLGHDRGSYVALRLALDHPDSVNRLILADCIRRTMTNGERRPGIRPLCARHRFWPSHGRRSAGRTCPRGHCVPGPPRCRHPDSPALNVMI